MKKIWFYIIFIIFSTNTFMVFSNSQNTLAPLTNDPFKSINIIDNHAWLHLQYFVKKMEQLNINWDDPVIISGVLTDCDYTVSDDASMGRIRDTIRDDFAWILRNNGEVHFITVSPFKGFNRGVNDRIVNRVINVLEKNQFKKGIKVHARNGGILIEYDEKGYTTRLNKIFSKSNQAMISTFLGLSLIEKIPVTIPQGLRLALKNFLKQNVLNIDPKRIKILNAHELFLMIDNLFNQIKEKILYKVGFSIDRFFIDFLKKIKLMISKGKVFSDFEAKLILKIVRELIFQIEKKANLSHPLSDVAHVDDAFVGYTYKHNSFNSFEVIQNCKDSIKKYFPNCYISYGADYVGVSLKSKGQTAANILKDYKSKSGLFLVMGDGPLDDREMLIYSLNEDKLILPLFVGHEEKIQLDDPFIILDKTENVDGTEKFLRKIVKSSQNNLSYWDMPFIKGKISLSQLAGNFGLSREQLIQVINKLNFDDLSKISQNKYLNNLKNELLREAA